MLYTMKELLDVASKENYAIAAPNCFHELDAGAYIEAAEESNAPLILDVLYTAHPDIRFFGNMLRYMAEHASVPIAINLDHGGAKHEHIKAIQAGFTSVMVDRSALDFDDNVKEVKEIADMAHMANVSVEAELGHVGMANNYENDGSDKLTSPSMAKEYIALTDVDALAVAIGTAHGAYPRGFTPYLDFERLVQIKKETDSFPLVLHGSSGTKIEDLRSACRLGINKVNISNDLCKASAIALQEADLDGQKAYDVWNIAKEATKKKLIEMIEVYGSFGKGK